MDTKVKCLCDADGFTKGSTYPVLGFGDTVCMVRNDNGHVVGIGLAKFNDDALWDLQPLEGDKKKPHGKD